MIEVRSTSTFTDWLADLRDRQARARIVVRLERIEAGNFGDHKSVGEGVSELRLTYGPGYRIYLTRQGETVVILLCGGDKGSQAGDIREAKRLVKEL